jgi:hypothetical protein
LGGEVQTRIKLNSVLIKNIFSKTKYPKIPPQKKEKKGKKTLK